MAADITPEPEPGPGPEPGSGHCRGCGKAAKQLRQCSKCHTVRYCSTACQTGDWARHRSHCVPVVAGEVAGRGRGLLATRPLPPGTLLTRDTAALVLPPHTDLWEAGSRIAAQLARLPSPVTSQFYRLTPKQELLSLCDGFRAAAGSDPARLQLAERVEQTSRETAIFFNNDIESEDGSQCLHLSLALCNHSCAPNSVWVRTSSSARQLELRAVRDIGRGEEVTVSYTLVEQRWSPRHTRQQRLRQGWEFDCCCQLCNNTGQAELLEGELVEVRELQKRMQDLASQEVDRVDWAGLADLQLQLVERVAGLPHGPALLHREYTSLCRLAQLARQADVLERARRDWAELLDRLGLHQAAAQWRQEGDRLQQWQANLHRGLQPHAKEVQQFLWLM